MSIIGLDGEYLVGIQLFTVDKEELKEARKEQLKAVVSDVTNKLPKLTINDLKGMVKGNTSILPLIEGFESYKNYGISALTNLMRPRSMEQLVSTAVKGLAAASRIANPLGIVPNKEVDLGLREQDFVELKIEEYLGIMLPVFSVTFSVQDKAIYKSLNKNSVINISFGRTMDDLVTMRGSIFKPIIRDQEQGGIVTLRGFLDAPGFLERENQYHNRGTSFNVVQNFLKEFGLTLTSNLSPDMFKDDMLWRSPTSRPIEYIINIWKHCFVSPESQIASTILATGEMLWTDLTKARELAKEEDYKIQYGDRVIFKQNPFYANFGSIRDLRYVFSTAASSMNMLKLNDQKSAVASVSNEIIQTGSRVGKYSILTPEMHKNWYLAELLNCSKVFSSLNQTAWIRPEIVWKKFKPTDIISIQSVDSPDVGQYLVCGRIAHIENRKFNTWLHIGRDNYVATTGTSAK